MRKYMLLVAVLVAACVKSPPLTAPEIAVNNGPTKVGTLNKEFYVQPGSCHPKCGNNDGGTYNFFEVDAPPGLYLNNVVVNCTGKGVSSGCVFDPVAINTNSFLHPPSDLGWPSTFAWPTRIQWPSSVKAGDPEHPFVKVGINLWSRSDQVWLEFSADEIQLK